MNTCPHCGIPVLYLQGGHVVPGKACRCDARLMSFKTPAHQHVLLDDGTLVTIPQGTTLMGHAIHDPICPRAPRPQGRPGVPHPAYTSVADMAKQHPTCEVGQPGDEEGVTHED